MAATAKREKYMTPVWASKLPEGVEVVRIHGRWFLFMWTWGGLDEDNNPTPSTAISQADPEQWLLGNGELGDSVELELWIPPMKPCRDLANDLYDQEAAAVKESETAATGDETIKTSE